MICLVDGLLDGVVMTKSLPLSIHRVYTPARKEALLDESLPIDLVLILFARVLLCDLEYFDKLSDSEPCPLT